MSPEAFLILVCVLAGLAVGSFVNVVIWRVPRHESVARPPSHCPACNSHIAPYDNIPVVSWILLRGRCRRCDARISVRYPAVEIACAGLWVAMALRFGASWELLAYLVLVSALLALSVIDLDTFLLPNRIVYPLAVALVVLFGLAAVATGDWASFLRAVLSGLGAFTAFLILHLITPAGMGLGDVKLMFCLGIALGWVSVGAVFLGTFVGFLLGAIVGVALIMLGRKGRKDHVPFGPFLATGTVFALCFSQPLLRAYMGS
ncbi:MAG: prepilin peptidase [Acidimicrobiia bacterium]|nr:prepilin peptidase [Acidimicrobiia bacterium]